MTDAEILEVVQRSVRSETGNASAVVTAQTTAADVPGWDSLAHGRIMLLVGIELGVRFALEDTYAATNVGELIPVFRMALEQAGR